MPPSYAKDELARAMSRRQGATSEDYSRHFYNRKKPVKIPGRNYNAAKQDPWFYHFPNARKPTRS